MMSVEEELRDQITTGFASIEASPLFQTEEIWLTFYFCAQAEKMRPVAFALADNGWLGTEDWDHGFLYPKVRVPRTLPAILSTAEWTLRLCRDHEVELLNLDADTSPDVSKSQFIMVYQSS